MTRQTMINQIVTMTTAGMVNGNEVPDNKDDFFLKIKNNCFSLMKEPPSDDEINTAFETGMPVEFSEILKTLAV